MKSFVINRDQRLVLPSNIFPDIDFSVLETLEQFSAVVRRDFAEKAPTSRDILGRIGERGYRTRYDLLRDLGLNLFWVNRFSITLYEKRPTAWRHVPKRRDDIFLPLVNPWPDAERKITAVAGEFRRLPPRWSEEVEDRIFRTLFDIYSHRRHDGIELTAIKPTVAEILENPANLTFHIAQYDPDFPTFSWEEIVDCNEQVPELEALMRWAMVLHNQYPWPREHTRLIEVGKLEPDDVVPVFAPRSREALQFIRRAKAHRPSPPRSVAPPRAARPAAPYPPVQVRRSFRTLPRLESLAIVKGEIPCTNDDLIRNSAFSWSSMTADEIVEKTGIACRLYTARSLEDISLEAAERALEHAGRSPADIGAVLFCTCTSTRLMPSMATWLCGELGIYQTHASSDVIAACAGLVYGLAECVRLLQEVERPVLLVCGEKFSDKIGSVRTSRMIFGDGAAALVIGPAPAGQAPDVELLQTYASGPHSEVNSIIWPNPEFGNNITVYGPEVQSLVRRYLAQMMEELRELQDPDDRSRSLLDAVDLVVPHQANRTMVVKLASAAGLRPEQLYFNIDKVGNTSSASIPIAIFDAVREGIITRPLRVFTPAFGAGAVGGYAVVRIDPAIVAESGGARPHGPHARARRGGSTVNDMQRAFGP